MNLAVVPAATLLAALAWFARLAMSADRAVQVRNAFLVRAGARDDFEWTPAAVPPGFRVERRMPPAAIVEAVEASGALAIDRDWPRARALVTMLVRHARRGGAVRAGLATTWREIKAGNGYCADYVRVYLAAASAAGLFCRQWAFSATGFGGSGHTFVEVFDRQRARWAFLDVHNNVYATRAGSDAPLDALELHDALRSRPEAVAFVRAGEGRLGYEHPEKLVTYYCRGLDEWCLWWGNDVVTRSETGVAGLLGRVSGSLGHRLGVALWGTPPIVAWATPGNRPALLQLARLRRHVVLALSVAAASLAALAAALLWPIVSARG